MKVIILLSDIAKWIKNIFSESFGSDPENGRIPFKFLDEKIIETIKTKKDKLGNRLILPDIVILKFSPLDRAYRKNVEGILCEELKISVNKTISRWKNGNEDYNVEVIVDTDKSLENGEFYVECKFNDIHSLKKNNKVSIYPYSRNDLSRTFIPPVSQESQKNNDLINTLMAPGTHPRRIPKISKEVCKLTIKDNKGERIFYLTAGLYNIGRGNDSDIQLDSSDKLLSRSHLKLVVKERGITMTMRGKNGGKVNKGYVEPGSECLIVGGDQILVGNSKLTISK